MRVTTYLHSEMEAHRLVYQHRSLTTGQDFRAECNDACNQIIALAERIKADRSGATLQMVANITR